MNMTRKTLRRNRIAFCATLVAGIVLSASAYDTEGYIYLMASDQGSGTAAASFSTAGNWSSGVAPETGKKYFTNGKALLCTSTSETFLGDVLAVNNNFIFKSTWTAVPCLHILDNAYFYNGTSGRTLKSSSITNYATGTNARFCYYSTSGKDDGTYTYTFDNVTFAGAADTKLGFKTTLNAGTFTYVFNSNCNAAEDYGTWTVASTYDSPASITEMSLADIAFGGTLLLNDKTQLRASGTIGPTLGALEVQKNGRIILNGTAGYTVGDLTLEDGAIIEVTADLTDGKGITVNGTLTVNGTVTVVYPDKSVTEAADTAVSKIIKLGAAATGTIDPDAFSCTKDPFVRDVTFTYNENDNSLDLTCVGVVTKTTKDTSAAESCFISGTNWSSGEKPADKPDYLYYAGRYVYMPAGSSTFAGRTLFLASDVNASAAGNTCTIDDLRLYPTANFSFSNNGYGISLCGKMTVAPSTASDTFTFYDRNNARFDVCSEICGTGDLIFKAGMGDNYSSDPRANFSLTSLNTNYTGKLLFTSWPTVYKEYTKKTVIGPNNTYCTTVTVSDERNLGGPLDALRYDALELAYYSKLNVTNDLVLSDATRGIKATGVGRFNVGANNTLTVTNKQITYAGKLVKDGKGRLVLGGTAKFLDGTLATPYDGGTFLEGTNVLSIAAGSLEVTDATATKNLAITFADGTGLVVRPGATDDRALDVTGDGASLTLPAAGLPVTLDVAGRTPAPFTAVVCKAKSADLAFKLASKVSTDWPGFRAKLQKSTDEGVTTYTAVVERSGFCLLFR